MPSHQSPPPSRAAVAGRRQVLGGLGAAALAAGGLLPPSVGRAAPAQTAAAALLPATLPPPVSFDVLRGGDVIGSHQVDFRGGSTNDFSVRTRINIVVKLLGITVFVFRHDGTERWRSGRLQAFESKTTDDDGEFFVNGRASGDGFDITHRKGTEVAPADIMVGSYWTPSIARQTQLIDPQRGRLKTQQLLSTDMLAVPVDGKPIETTRYRVVGLTDGWVAYDAAGRWLAAEVKKKGTDILYRLRG